MLFRDLLYAAQALGTSPVFTITAVVTIALGIGSSAAIFSVTNAVLLRRLPYRNPDRLVLPTADMRVRHVQDFAAVNTFRAIFPREDGSLEQTTRRLSRYAKGLGEPHPPG